MVDADHDQEKQDLDGFVGQPARRVCCGILSGRQSKLPNDWKDFFFNMSNSKLTCEITDDQLVFCSGSEGEATTWTAVIHPVQKKTQNAPHLYMRQIVTNLQQRSRVSASCLASPFLKNPTVLVSFLIRSINHP